MSCKASSKLLHTLAHSHTPYNVSSHATRDTEGIRRGLCNKERTKQFRYGCGKKTSSHSRSLARTLAHSLLRFGTAEPASTAPERHLSLSQTVLVPAWFWWDDITQRVVFIMQPPAAPPPPHPLAWPPFPNDSSRLRAQLVLVSVCVCVRAHAGFFCCLE